MSKTKNDIILSVSAAAAAITTLAQVSEPNAENNQRLNVVDVTTPYQGAIDDILSNNAVQMNLVAAMPNIMGAADMDLATMEQTWGKMKAMNLVDDNENGTFRVALSIGDLPYQTDTLLSGQSGSGVGRLLGHNQDGVVNDNSAPLSGVTNCYSNCHVACHGSRGWR